MTTLIFDSSTQTVYTDSRVTTEGAEVPNTYEKGIKACYKPYGEYIVTVGATLFSDLNGTVVLLHTADPDSM